LCEGERAEGKCISPVVYFIANVNTVLYAFYTGKDDLLKKNYEANKREGAPRPLLELATAL